MTADFHEKNSKSKAMENNAEEQNLPLRPAVPQNPFDDKYEIEPGEVLDVNDIRFKMKRFQELQALREKVAHQKREREQTERQRGELERSAREKMDRETRDLQEWERERINWKTLDDLFDNKHLPQLANDITFTIQGSAGCVAITLPRPLVIANSHVWECTIIKDKVENDGFGLCINYWDVESGPFCLLIYHILASSPDFSSLAKLHHRLYCSRQRTFQQRILVLLKTALLIFRFRLKNKEVKEKLLMELEDNYTNFVLGRNGWRKEWDSFGKALMETRENVDDLVVTLRSLETVARNKEKREIEERQLKAAS